MWTVDVVRIYTGSDNRSHFEDLVVPMSEVMQEGGRSSLRTALIPTKAMLFRENPLGGPPHYHTPKQRQFVVTITGAVECSGQGGSCSPRTSPARVIRIASCTVRGAA